ncbi:MAG: hypothetical protein A2Y10_11385 [Planctomycetes bacterium GWF2_41_51]|nr:MAG: hypothetical protein A2Y10_11385 [Planctomycetes bacterium GWF2_41_51]HBG26362.1 hypothetical protein [Phycisphaerales bacterium]
MTKTIRAKIGFADLIILEGREHSIYTSCSNRNVAILSYANLKPKKIIINKVNQYNVTYGYTSS